MLEAAVILGLLSLQDDSAMPLEKLRSLNASAAGWSVRETRCRWKWTNEMDATLTKFRYRAAAIREKMGHRDRLQAHPNQVRPNGFVIEYMYSQPMFIIRHPNIHTHFSGCFASHLARRLARHTLEIVVHSVCTCHASFSSTERRFSARPFGRCAHTRTCRQRAHQV